ncbi:dihydrodipicolinate synthase family protein [Streptomyces sp. SID14478]|uniref:dihydrodipicolinate synthase family protein n=1 Tax=Streptomyces sp. SID14478 TaxID=2706073 RepID=UPI0013DCBBB3|nr:dihydrodipicolinate synthase family protein [Streptomyces sp. SID14478]NEB74883.1 dihydrodipicolinate synthase family protein [Streptomyces sp. SID14478]
MSLTEHHPVWRGVLVATALPLNDDLSVDFAAYADHCAWLVAQGCDGVVPNGSLGEYQVLTPEERAEVVETAVAAIGGAKVMPGVAAYGCDEAKRWAQQAKDAGCAAVMLLPPNAYRADGRSVRAHYAAVAEVGIDIVAYNNPHDTKVDLTPELLAELHAAGYIKGVKEFSGDPRRLYRIEELAPDLDVLIGADDVLLELAAGGARGWISGYPNALPKSAVELYHAAVKGDLATAVPLYKKLHALYRWDSQVEFVQAIKLSMDIVGRRGGPCRAPRVPLLPEQEKAVREATEKAVALGLR